MAIQRIAQLFKITGLFAIALLTLLGCAKDNSLESELLSPIRVGLPVSLSGNWAMLGNEVVKGATLAQEEINASGGLLGRKLEFLVQDSDEAISPVRLLSSYRELRAQNVQLFIGPTGTPGGLALAPIALREDVVLIAPAVGVMHGFAKDGGNIFNIQGGWEIAAKKLARYAYDKGHRRIAIFSSQHPFERTQADAFSAEFQAQGGIITTRVDPQPDTNDLRTEAKAVVQSAPDAIFQSNYNQMAEAARRVRELKFSGQIFAIQIDPSRLVGSAGALDRAIFGGLTHYNQEFASKYQKRFSSAPNYPADFAYDAVMLLAESIRATNSFEPRLLAKRLHGISWTGASGNFSIGNDGAAIRVPGLYQVDGEKFLEIAEP